MQCFMNCLNHFVVIVNLPHPSLISLKAMDCIIPLKMGCTIFSDNVWLVCFIFYKMHTILAFNLGCSSTLGMFYLRIFTTITCFATYIYIYINIPSFVSHFHIVLLVNFTYGLGMPNDL